jgi:hypothetical protein
MERELVRRVRWGNVARAAAVVGVVAVVVVWPRLMPPAPVVPRGEAVPLATPRAPGRAERRPPRGSGPLRRRKAGGGKRRAPVVRRRRAPIVAPAVAPPAWPVAPPAPPAPPPPAAPHQPAPPDPDPATTEFGFER